MQIIVSTLYEIANMQEFLNEKHITSSDISDLVGYPPQRHSPIRGRKPVESVNLNINNRNGNGGRIYKSLC